MTIFGQTISILFALAFLGALGIGGYWAIDYIAALFLSMDTQVARVTGVASVAVLLAAALIAGSIRQAGKQFRAIQFQADKAATYKLFIDTWTNLLRERGGSAKQSAFALPEVLQALDQPLALYGSPAVIKAHAAQRALAVERGMQNPEIRSQFSKALLEVRKDLGSDTRGLTAEALQDLLLPEARGSKASDMPSASELRAGMTLGSR
jgi:hypothetical protein